ncbi:hypothetical protein AK812_SmicGene46377 [Symbiodinium microadriaticum]|uniref:Uncharacterized protein n=1 Tax=Symbiodinium microadriaticum TaxID=2951 RepID=A0A1Q9BU54_SYMMI|nr:hypothetical protein AK812_SmicGene46377 [Symbiodinium microadriaticum]
MKVMLMQRTTTPGLHTTGLPCDRTTLNQGYHINCFMSEPAAPGTRSAPVMLGTGAHRGRQMRSDEDPRREIV